MSSAFISVDRSWVPESCTLPTVEQPVRVEEFERVLSTHVVTGARFSPTLLRVSLTADPEVVGHVAELAARESECCAFFTFTLTLASQRATLDVVVPESHAEVLTALESQLLAATSR